ncbi:hypothetical protein [Simplicispira hankyongi]|uniref:hypothetical protein n=1 Tax=Simplicispira hankyongi TaxID=2315688 RepID=UPI001FE3B1A2|nr:hypothetical protein [Simplicispira hankyongi]
MSAQDMFLAPVSAWAQHLMAPVVAEQRQLPPGEAQRVQRLHDQLLAALQARDRRALRSARQAVLEAALVQPGSPAERSALRALAWRMAALLPAAIRRGQNG